MISLNQKSAVIVGASAGIGAALSRLLVNDGYQVALVARREDKLKDMAAKYNELAGRTVAHPFAHDVTQFDEVPELFDRCVEAMGGLTHIFYVAGVMPRVERDEYDFEKDRQMVEVNLLGMMAWLNRAADFFTRTQQGTIIGVGSIAGDRGRAGQPGYNSTKGAQAIFLEALRNRLHRHNVRVVTIKPGPVDTEMTAGLGSMPLMISADYAAKIIFKAAETSRTTVYAPWHWRLIAWGLHHTPSWIFRRLG